MFYQILHQPHTIQPPSYSTYLPPYRTGRSLRSISAAELARHSLLARAKRLLSHVSTVIGQQEEEETAVSPTSLTEK